MDMGHNDSLQRNRTAIIQELATYGIIDFEIVQLAKTQAVRINYNGQTRSIAFTNKASSRSPANCRTITRRMMGHLGLQPLPRPVKRKTEQSANPSPDDKIIADEIPITQQEQSTMNDYPDFSALAAEMAEAVSTESDRSDYRHAPPTHTKAGYVVFQSTKYHSIVPQYQLTNGRFFAVNIQEDLIVPRGTYLVIPMHAKDVVLPMQEAEFRAFFEPLVEEHTGEPEFREVRPDQQSEQIGDVRSEEPVMEPVVEPVVETVSEKESVVDERPSTGVDTELDFGAIYPLPTDPDRVAFGDRVAPQMGQLLLAFFALHANGQQSVESATILPLLNIGKPSLSTQISLAVRARYLAKRDEFTTRANRYFLTSYGHDLVRTLGTRPFDSKQIPVPNWLSVILDQQQQNPSQTTATAS